MEGAYWPVVSVLASRYPDTWGLIPKGLMNFGGGGVNAFGSVCGTPNGASALLAQMGAPQNVKNALMMWYEKTLLPSNAAYLDYRSGTWVPGGTSNGTWGPGGCPIPLNNIPKSRADSVICHVSLTKWRAVADSYLEVMGNQTSDRCGKVTYDTAYFVANLINQWKAGATINGDVSIDASAAGCKNAACHGGPPESQTAGTAAQGNLKCTPCHTQRIGDNHNL